MKYKDIQKMSKNEREKKLKELRLELVKSKVSGAKTGNSKIKEIKKIIARLMTLNSLENKPKEKQKK
jgi:ribosomal protein L29